MEDLDHMRLAVELAKRGTGWTAPNPLVGAVLVKDGTIIGQGWHAKCGELHAERHALQNCTASPRGATLYVTLEPCCHQGRQPPCTDAILEAGIARVVVGSSDPNPLVAGKGLELLRSRGVEVESGVLKSECDALNPVFFHFIQTRRPYVVMKYAMTMDGKIATRTGASQWITGDRIRMGILKLCGVNHKIKFTKTITEILGIILDKIIYQLMETMQRYLRNTQIAKESFI